MNVKIRGRTYTSLRAINQRKREIEDWDLGDVNRRPERVS